MQTNLQTKIANIQQNKLQAPPENIKNKMTSIWQEKKMDIISNNHHNHEKVELSSKDEIKVELPPKSINKIELSPKDMNKINQFIDELKSRVDKKEFFAHVFKTMIHLGKGEKEKLIAGVAQTLKSSADPESELLNQKFNKSLCRYMSISLMSTPLMNQFRHNMSSFSLEGSDDEEEIDLF